MEGIFDFGIIVDKIRIQGKGMHLRYGHGLATHRPKAL
jgi:hypothetical protein